MIRKFFASLMCLYSVSSFSACPIALPISDPNFCTSFKTAAVCYCSASGLPEPMCKQMGMSWLYSQMKSTYGSLEGACANQKYTTKEDCMANWYCYGTGKVPSKIPTTANCLKVCESIKIT